MANHPDIANATRALQARVAAWRATGESVALVPTMGALHDGHLALVDAAAKAARRVVVSIFVNPTQFAPNEDFSRYPRTFDADRAKLAAKPVDLIWAPSVEEMYPAGFATRIVPAGPAEGLESVTRPHFFAGVATVVAKLLLQVRPDVALFGEKDFQQLRVIERLVADLDIPVRIEGVPIVREADGLALSSRNAYLAPAERAAAPALHRALAAAAAAIEGGAAAETALAEARQTIAAAGFVVDYVELRDAATLAAPAAGRPRRLLAAAKLGATRLIDNVAVGA
ncbi:MAG TPA: pantoate--beta-alanine ligase [Hyphomicrobiales bacterium]|nr:pantoate--beta-alanine ligase [Hyphomicrobiales bacterium]